MARMSAPIVLLSLAVSLALAPAAGAAVSTYTSTPGAFIPDALPPGPGTPQSVSDSLLVGDAGTLVGITVTVTIEHPELADVEIDLTDPSGLVTVRLFDREAGVADGLFDVTFDDAASSPPPDFLTNGQCLTGSTFLPAESLAAFAGVPIAGSWTLTVSDAGYSDASDCDCDGFVVGPACPRTLDSWSMEIEYSTNQPPVASCHDVTVEADPTSCTAAADVDDGSYDPDGDALTLTTVPAGPYGLGHTAVSLTAEDPDGLSDSCTATVTVTDGAAPVVACNAPAAITPPDAPVTFTATASDACGAAAVEVTGTDCFMETRKGKRVDKTGSCVVARDGDQVTVIDSGGVGDTIVWTVSAEDAAGNTIEQLCSVAVENPGRGH